VGFIILQSAQIAKLMFTKPMKTSPPQVLSDYFSAANDGRIDDAAACFASDALVHDENHDRQGIEAIRVWIEETTQKYRPQVEIDHIESVEGGFVTTGTVSGTFPGSPIALNYTFSIRDGKISQLTIQ
jgi:hypothetical protein